MKYSRFFYVVILALSLAFSSCSQEKVMRPKYVFYVIGDGMGPNQILLSRMFHAETKGVIGVDSLSFTGFPYYTNAFSYSSSNAITCSAAAGTALASGVKTSEGTIGMNADHSAPVYSIAHFAKNAGMKVGITTSVSIDHATPAVFYAHQPERGMYYQIGFDAINANYDLYAGSDFLRYTDKNDSNAPELIPSLEKAGYTIARGKEEFGSKSSTADKLILMQKADKDKNALPFAIDRKKDDVSLSDIVETSIEFLSKKADDKGFFIMIEAGKIDWASHANDAATTLREVDDMSEMMKKVIAFYQAHKDETLIVVTADHETGGLALGRKGYTLNLKALAHQNISKEDLSQYISAYSKEKEGKVSWEEIKTILAEKLGFWKEVEISEKQEKALKECYIEVFSKKKDTKEETMYATTGAITNLAINTLAEVALINWSTTSHSAASVPVYAIGVGAEQFKGDMNNTDIPKIMAKIMGLEMTN